MVVVNLVVLPFTALSALLWLASFNPLLLIVDFEVHNRTQGALAITPLGSVHGAPSERWVLPTYANAMPAVEAWEDSDLVIRPGESIELSYDCDDIQFTELLISDAGGERFVMTTGSLRSDGNYSGPGALPFVIDERTVRTPVVGALPFTLRGTEGRQRFPLLLRVLPWLVHLTLLVAWITNSATR